MFTLPPRRWRKNSTRVYSLLEFLHLFVSQPVILLLNLFGERVGAGPRRFHDAYLRRVELLHDFFDGHVGEMLRVEHEAVVLIQLREAQPRLVVRVEFLRVFQKRKKRRN